MSASGPARSRETASILAHEKGELRYEEHVFYDTPRIPGRQFSVARADGRFLRGGVYMAGNRLYITEATAGPADVAAFKFEQSISLIEENGTDLDTNPVSETPTIGPSGGLPSRQYACKS